MDRTAFFPSFGFRHSVIVRLPAATAGVFVTGRRLVRHPPRVAGTGGGKPTAAEGFLMRVRWRGLELPSKVHSDRGILTDTFGKFYVEPFERGFGMTIGNSLRRILLSSLEGSAITRVKI